MPHHLHDHFHHVRQDDGASVATIMSVVYVTAEPTFNGPVGGYVTGTSGIAPTGDAASDTAAASSAPTSLSPMPSFDSSSSMGMSTSLSPMPSMSSAQPTTLSPMPRVSSSAAALSSISSIPDSSFATPTSSTGSDSTSTAAPQEKDASQPQSTGMSSGAKAGLAFGIIIAVAILAGLAFFLWRRKKDNEEAQKKNADNEKNGQQQNGGLQPRVSVKKANTATAPRLSLRPLTNLFADSNADEKQSNTGANGGLVAPMAAHTRPRSTESKNSAWERGFSEKDVVDPFGDHAEVKPDSDNVDASAVPKPLNVSRPSSPSSTGANSPPLAQGPNAGAAAGTDSKAGMNVYRVQMDFIPSMDDELELRAGQLVRLLHEYDDGWCLCIRLDRSQQGVIPRTCISKQPVKPRPAPPPGAAARGPPGARPRPNGPPPAGGRMRSQSNAPQAGPFGTGQYRGQTTSPSQPQGRARAQSSASASSPPKGSPLESANSGSVPSRKPVPGQAM